MRKRKLTRRVKGESGPVTNDSSETGQESEGVIAAANGRRSTNERTGSSSVFRNRNGHGDGGSRNDEDFENESVTKVVRVDEEERELDQPEQEVGNHVDSRDAR